MASERYAILEGRVVGEEELLDSLQISLPRPLEEVLTALRKGTLLLKHGRHGRPKVHYFRLMGGDTLLRWRSASGSIKTVPLRAVGSLTPGQASEVFRRHPLPSGAAAGALCWSLAYADEGGTRRTLDLTAPSAEEARLWVSGLRLILAWLARGPQPRRAGGQAPAPPWPAPGAIMRGGAAPRHGLGHGGAAVAPGPDARRGAAGGAGVGSPRGPPIPADQPPGDLLVWGSCGGAGASAPASAGAGAQDLWTRSPLPVPLPGNAGLDVVCAAVGLRHGALVTRCGAVYAWGQGRAGKLGLGHDRDAPEPRRVAHALAGQRAVCVAAGDDYTAALTASGAVYMWGRLAGAPAAQTVPLPVRGELAGRAVAQLSCGPFHCGAVTVAGELFTWGEGFGGRLGHGDRASRASPCLVRRLAPARTLEVACGVWHTAAIVQESTSLGEVNPLEAAAVLAGAVVVVPGGCGGIPGGAGAGAPPGPGLGAPPCDAPGAHHPSPPPPPPASPPPHAHRRSSSAGSLAGEHSFFHEGVGGSLFTWGGVNEPVAYGDRQEKRDSNRGCLAHGDADLYTGQLLPCRVATPEPRAFRHVAAGSHLTVTVTTGGRVWQAGATGASAGRGAGACPWEGATSLQPVRGALAGYFIDRVAAGMHHVLAAGRLLDRRTGLPVDAAAGAAVFAWGRGAEGQLGQGPRARDAAAAPQPVEALRGRGAAAWLAAGGATCAVVLPHDARRFDPEPREAGETAAKALLALLEPGQGGGQKNDGGAPRAPKRPGLLHVPEAMLSSLRSGAASAGARAGGLGLFRPSMSSTTSSPPSEGASALRRSSSFASSARGPGAAVAQRRGLGPSPSASQVLGIPKLAPGPGGRRQVSDVGVSASRVVSLGSPTDSTITSLGSAGRRGPGGSSRSLASLVPPAQSAGRDAAADSVDALVDDLQQWTLNSNGVRARASMGGASVELHAPPFSGRHLAGGSDGVSPAPSLGSCSFRSGGGGWGGPPSGRRREAEAGSSAGAGSDERLRARVLASAGAYREAVLLCGRRGAGAEQASATEGGRQAGGSAPALPAGAALPGPPSLARLSAGWGSSVAPSIPDSDLEATVSAMEALLARRQAQLSNQEQRLGLWAEELRQRELELQQRSALLSEAPAAGDWCCPSPEAGPPASSHSGPAAHSRASSLIREGSLPGSPLSAAPEWDEALEEGVTATFTLHRGARRVRRIRFSRARFTKESAAVWYEAHKHGLAQRLAGEGRAGGGAADGEGGGGPGAGAGAGSPAPGARGGALAVPARAHGHTLSFDVGEAAGAGARPHDGDAAPRDPDQGAPGPLAPLARSASNTPSRLGRPRPAPAGARADGGGGPDAKGDGAWGLGTPACSDGGGPEGGPTGAGPSVDNSGAHRAGPARFPSPGSCAADPPRSPGPGAGELERVAAEARRELVFGPEGGAGAGESAGLARSTSLRSDAQRAAGAAPFTPRTPGSGAAAAVGRPGGSAASPGPLAAATPRTDGSPQAPEPRLQGGGGSGNMARSLQRVRAALEGMPGSPTGTEERVARGDPAGPA
uniref:PH domain-containing protein n=1 Tax=Auxenochlorella protothecoides TaxID=3075 RepID=A0A1D1ZXM7_AUXPR